MSGQAGLVGSNDRDRGHKRQHFIPQSYLKAWCDPLTPEGHEPYVWQYDKDGASCRKRPPRKIFHEKDLYTTASADGARDLEVEHALAKLEDRFTRIRRMKLEMGRRLDGADAADVRKFMAVMQARTPWQLRHWRRQWANIAELGRRAQREWDATKEPPFHSPPSGRPSASIEEIEALAALPLGAWIPMVVDVSVPILREMRLAIFVTDDPVGFITSDAPCVWFDPERAPLGRGLGLGSSTIEITLPASPRQMLVLTWRPNLVGRVKIDSTLLAELNRRTRFHAREHFVARSDRPLDVWFRDRPA